ncbi:MAG: hybrid sensor histidine kinase/response regulator [Symploca sp. SIO1B1]|nr:hybrid sensor histidine kinase/response regulator [Symploca sp. SIO1B1]
MDDLASLLGEDMPTQEQELDWQTDLFGSELPTQTVETPATRTAEVDDLASLLGEDMPTQEQELDWETDLFDSEVPAKILETPAPTAAEVDDLASLLSEDIPTQKQELDWETDLFGSELPTQTVETPAPTTAEVDDLASLLSEDMPTQEQEIDWPTDLFGSEVPAEILETTAPTVAEVDDLASLLSEEVLDEEPELELTDKQKIDNLPEEEITEVLEPEDRQEFLPAEADGVTDVQEWPGVSETVEDREPEVVSEFNQLETMLEEEASLTTVSRTTAMFDELETMLDEEAPLTTASSTTAMFDELEAMLDEEPSLTTASSTTAMFDELEAMLQEETPKIAEQSPQQEKIKAKAEDDDEFGDLEIMLEQADKTMGGPPTIKTDQRQNKPQSRMRPRMFDQTMRVQIKRLDDLSNLVGELVVNRNSLEQDQERLRQFLDNLNHQVLSLNDVGARMQDLYERSLLESSLLASRHNYRSFFGGESPPENSQANAEYDPLEMDRFTGFHTLSQEMIELIVRVRESASDIVFLADGTDQVARTLRQITTQLQEGLTRARMVPFAQTADRLPRAVRDISLKLGKQAELQVEGRETLIDKMIIEHLNAPMTHLVNNAITHGIETPEVRQAANKPSAGKITVRAFYQGNQAVISISDDGAGINPEKVRNKIIEKKLLTPAEAKKLSNLDLYEFLFDAGFTTKEKADDFSGRGVGMDVVRTKLNEIRGTIHTDSTLGKGTTFTIRLPLTLSIGKALCCLSERATIAFPMDGVEETFDIPPDRVHTDSEGQSFIQWKDTRLPFKPLTELLKYNRHLSRGSVYGGKREDGLISVLVLRSASNNFLSIQVDQVLSEQEIVIKQLEGPAPKPVGIAGATVLGDGRIMPIADVMELIDLSRRPNRPDSPIWSRAEGQTPVEEAPHEPMVLIVDDSITVRSLLEMTFSKAGYRVEQARDGQEAWEKLRSGLPCDIIFCDIEMPRMNGMELLKKLQEDENLRDIPISMLTSRGADRHRQMAVQLGASGYFTKPYLEEVLLEAAQEMINGEVLLDASSNA